MFEGVTEKPGGGSGPVIEDDGEDTKHEDQSKGRKEPLQRGSVCDEGKVMAEH